MNGNKNKFFEVFLQEFNRLRSKSDLVNVIISIAPSCIYDNGYFLPVINENSLSSMIDEVRCPCLFFFFNNLKIKASKKIALVKLEA